MEINLETGIEFMIVEDLPRGSYFWYNNNLYLKPNLSTQAKNKEGSTKLSTLVILLEQEFLVTLSSDTKIAFEPKPLQIAYV